MRHTVQFYTKIIRILTYCHYDGCHQLSQTNIIFCPLIHHTNSRNNMGKKCKGNCGLWVLNEIIKRIYPENLKKIMIALWELPAK